MLLAFSQTSFTWIATRILKQNKNKTITKRRTIPGWRCCDAFRVVHFFPEVCFQSACKMQWRSLVSGRLTSWPQDAYYRKTTTVRVYFAQYVTLGSVLWTAPPRLLTRLCCPAHGCGPPRSSVVHRSRPSAGRRQEQPTQCHRVTHTRPPITPIQHRVLVQCSLLPLTRLPHEHTHTHT